jgi:hypothetical protein
MMFICSFKIKLAISNDTEVFHAADRRGSFVVNVKHGWRCTTGFGSPYIYTVAHF